MNLDEVLATLRKHNVISAEVPSEAGVLRVVFGPKENEPMPGTPPTPGGWKSPAGLDAGREFEPEQREAP